MRNFKQKCMSLLLSLTMTMSLFVPSVSAIAATIDGDPLAAARKFNVFVEGNLTVPGADTPGTFAVGGEVRLPANYDVGGEMAVITDNDPESPTYSVKQGGFESTVLVQNEAQAGFTFAEAFAELRSVSQELAQIPTSAGTYIAPNEQMNQGWASDIIFHGTNDELNVFTMTVDQYNSYLKNAQSQLRFDFDVPLGSYVLINITGNGNVDLAVDCGAYYGPNGSVSLGADIPQTGLVLFNIPDAENVIINQTIGSLLAPNSHVVTKTDGSMHGASAIVGDDSSKMGGGSNPHFEGQLIAKSYYGCNEFGGKPSDVLVTPDVTPAAPYQVTFVTYSPSVIPSQSVESGNTAIEPNDPEKDGYTFKDWYLNPEGTGDPYDFGTPVTSDVTLYAVYEKIPEYVVDFVLDNALLDGTGAPQTVLEGENATEPSVNVKITNDSWYEAGSSTPFDFSTPITKDTTLYATTANVTVTFDKNGGTGTFPQQTMKSGETAEEPKTEPTMTGYKFVGWTLDDKIYDFGTPVFEDITLVAKYEALDQITVVFVENGGSEVNDATIYAGEGVTSSTETSWTKHNFEGWYLDEDFSGEAVDFTTATFTEDTKVYAKWTITVQFATNGGTDVASVTFAPKNTIPVGTDTTTTKDGFVFAGWYPTYQLTGDAIDFDSKIFTESTTVWAKWEENSDPQPTEYTVTYNFNGEDVGTETVVDGETAKGNDAADKWYTDEDCSKEFDFDTPITEDITLYAKTPATPQVTVKFDVNGGDEATTPVDQTFDKGGNAEEPTAPKYDGYTFLYWTLENTNEKFDFDTAVNDDITLYAKWEKNSDPQPTEYTVTFIYDGSTVGTATVEDGDTVTPNPNSDKWYTDEDCSKEFDFDTPITEDITVYAKSPDQKPTEYTVTYIFDGDTVDIETVVDGETANGNDAADKWYIDEDCSKEFDFTTPITEDIELYAKSPVTVIYHFIHANGDDEVLFDQTIPYGTATTPDDGYEDIHWYETADKANKVAFDFDTVLTAPVTDIYTFYVTVEFQDKDGNEVSVPIDVPEGSTIEDPDITAPDGSDVKGWYKDPDFTTPFEFGVDVIDKDTIIYVEYEVEDDSTPDEFTVTFIYDGSTVGTSTVEDGDKVTPNPKSDKWYTDENCTTEFNFNTPITTDITLYGKTPDEDPVTPPEPQPEEHTVTFIFDGKNVGTSTVEDGDKVTPNSNSDKWYTDENCTTEFKFDTPITTDITLYAKTPAKTDDPTPSPVPEKTITEVTVDGSKIPSDKYTVNEDKENVTFNPGVVPTGTHTVVITYSDGTSKVITVTVNDASAVVSTGELVSPLTIAGIVLFVVAGIGFVVVGLRRKEEDRY